MTIRLLLNNHGEMDESLSHVATLPVESLVVPGRVQRVIDTALAFDRAVLHLDSQELEQFLTESRDPFIALLVTTERGIPSKRSHVVGKDHVVLAVRRMRAFNRRTWQAFLAATRDDAVAVAEGRRADVSAAASDMRPLFCERAVLTELLQLRGAVYEHGAKLVRKDATNPAVRRTHEDMLNPESWLDALDKLERPNSERAAYSALDPHEAESRLLDDLADEGLTAEVAPEVLELVQAIAQRKRLSHDVVGAASLRLGQLM